MASNGGRWLSARSDSCVDTLKWMVLTLQMRAQILTKEQTNGWSAFLLIRSGRAFADITTRHVGKPFAIVLDGKVISAPVIREPITGGRGQISAPLPPQQRMTWLFYCVPGLFLRKIAL